MGEDDKKKPTSRRDEETGSYTTWSNLHGDRRERRARQLRMQADAINKRWDTFSEGRNAEMQEAIEAVRRDPKILEYFPPDKGARIVTRLEITDDGQLSAQLSRAHKRALLRFVRDRAWDLSKWLLFGTGTGVLGHVLSDWLKAVLHGH